MLPAAVTVSFDPSVRSAILEHTACADTPWKGKLGEAIIRSFQETGRTRFAQIAIVDTADVLRPVSTATGVTPVSATVKLLSQSITARTRTGADDRYTAQVDIRMAATFYDIQGQPVPDAPMVYSEGVSIFTPQFGGSGQCATQDLDAVMDTAVEHLTRQFGGYVEQFLAKLQSQPRPVTQTAAAAPVQPIQPSVEPLTALPRATTAPASLAQPAQTSPTSNPDQNRYAVVVGLGLYRSPWPGWRDGLLLDSEGALSQVARTLSVPDNHTLLLQDELASQADIEEALGSWLPKRVGKDALVFVYLSGQFLADSKTGEIYLIPYDSTPASSRTRLISLRWLQSRLQKLSAKLTLAIIDSPLIGAATPKDAKAKSPAPNWAADLAGPSGTADTSLIQIVRMPDASRQQTSLLAGLNGPADLDHDGMVTVGEWLRALRGNAVTVPTLPPTVTVQSVPLVRLNRQ
ncbi:MAG: hypothetical protein IT389_09140 [Nitrospira sp.]|nr:hypothetical protein [Nitrospira sp.]